MLCPVKFEVAVVFEPHGFAHLYRLLSISGLTSLGMFTSIKHIDYIAIIFVSYFSDLVEFLELEAILQIRCLFTKKE